MAGLCVVRGKNWLLPEKVSIGTIGCITRFVQNGGIMDVYVAWDGGSQSSHITFPGNCDIHVLDTDVLGIRHFGTKCGSCDQTNIRGYLWKCTFEQCDKTLCSQCYHSNKHNLKHIFQRQDKPRVEGKSMIKRQSSSRTKLNGQKPYGGYQYYVDQLPSICEFEDVKALGDKWFTTEEPVYDFDNEVPDGTYMNVGSRSAGENPEAAYINEDVDAGQGHSEGSKNVYMNQKVTEELPSIYENPQKSSDIPNDVYDELGGTPVIEEWTNEEELRENKPQKELKQKSGVFQAMLSKLKPQKSEKKKVVEVEKRAEPNEYVRPNKIQEEIAEYDELLNDPPPKDEPLKDADVVPDKVVTIRFYEANRSDELTFKCGEIITGVSVVAGEPKWLKGTLKGKTALFKRCDVKAVKEDMAHSPTKMDPTQRKLPPTPQENKAPATNKQPLTDTKVNIGPVTRKTRETTPLKTRNPRASLPPTPTDEKKKETIKEERTNSVTIRASYVQQTPQTKEAPVEKQKPKFKKADKVRLEKNREKVMQLQKGRGGWVDAMEEVLGEVGEVADNHASGDVFVKFASMIRRIHPNLLTSAATGVERAQRRRSVKLDGIVNRMTKREDPADEY